MRTFMASYNHEGEKWHLELKARDWQDAQARLNRLSFASLDGEVIASIPVPGQRLGEFFGRLFRNIQEAISPSRG